MLTIADSSWHVVFRVTPIDLIIEALTIHLPTLLCKHKTMQPLSPAK